MAENKNKKDADLKSAESQQETPKTETSRLKIKKDSANESSQDPAARQAAGDATQSREESQVGDDNSVTDPMDMRDTNTSKVRRVTGGKAGPEATAIVPGGASEDDKENKTDTVQLKVVQQKKKEIADMMSPSSTVRLRSPGGKRGKSGSRLSSQKARDTLKVPAPESTAADSGETNDKDKSASPEPAPSASEGKKSSTQPLKKMAPNKTEKGEEKTAGKTVKSTARNKPGQKSGRTLKIKAGGASRSGRAGAGQPARGGSEATVKIKPGQEDDATVKLSKEGADKTVKADQGGLRLKQPATESTSETEASQQQAVQPIPQAEAQPGIGFTLAALTAFAATGLLLFSLIRQTLTYL